MQLGTVIDNKINEALPLATRDYIQLTLLVPGSTHPSPNWFTAAEAGGSFRQALCERQPRAGKQLPARWHGQQPSVGQPGWLSTRSDAIQEFNMITNNAPAEFGNFQGGIISATIKSGTNGVHGSAYEFFRNDVLNANNWENELARGAQAKATLEPIWCRRGGPIIKNKLFFFGDYTGRRLNYPASTPTLSVFTAKERQGDFSELLAKGIQLYDPDPAHYIPDPATRDK